jgi:hypothetical protein
LPWCGVQTAVLGDVSFLGDFLNIPHVGDLDVDMVAMTDIGCLIVPENIVNDFIRSGKRHNSTCYYGVENMWDATR